MGEEILFKGKIHSSIAFVTITTSAVGVLLQLKYYQPFISAFFVSALLISLFAVWFEKKTTFPIFFIGLPWFILILAFFNISFNERYILFFIPLSILTFGGLVFYFAGYLFDYIWKFSNGFIKKKWEKLPRTVLNSRYREVIIGAAMLYMFHILLSLAFVSKDSIIAFEQGGIAIMFLIILIWAIKEKKKIAGEPYKIAALTFFTQLIMITFDSILTEILYLKGISLWLTSAFSVGLIFVLATKLLISPNK